jgi:hypothetical protein
MKTHHRGIAVVALLLALTACGGGGGGSEEATSAPTTLEITDSPDVTTGDTDDTPTEPASGSLRVGVATDLQTWTRTVPSRRSCTTWTSRTTASPPSPPMAPWCRGWHPP